jgi:hypothetical protein
MSVITKERSADQQSAYRRSLRLRAFREFSRNYLTGETVRERIVEIVAFMIIAAIAAWPIVEAIGALNKFLQRISI